MWLKKLTILFLVSIMAQVFCCGFDCAAAGSAAGTPHWVFGGNTSQYSTTKRNSDHSARINIASSGTASLQCQIATGGNTSVIRVYVRFVTLPSADTLLVYTGSGTAAIGIGYRASDSKLYMGSNTTPTFSTTTGVSVTTGIWYRLDLKLTNQSGVGTVGDGQVDGSALSQRGGGTGSGSQVVTLGSSASVTGEWLFDDYCHGSTSGDYPFGPGKVLHFVPAADGTHNIAGTGDFQRGNTGTDILNATTTAFQLVDDIPVPTTASSTDNIAAIGPPNATDYVECVFGLPAGGSWPSSAPRFVEAFVAYSAAATQTGNIRVALNDNGTTDDVLNLTAAGETGIKFARKGYSDPPSAASAWNINNDGSNGDFRDLRFRFYSSDAAPDQYLQAVLIEAEFDDVTGTLFTQNLGGSISAAGALKKDVSQKKTGSLTPAGSLKRDTSHFKAGSLTPSGIAIQLATKILGGSVSPSATLQPQRVFLKDLDGAVTPAGSLVKDSAKNLAGSIAASGAMAKSTSKPLAGSSTPSGALASLKSAVKQLAGSIAASGAITRAISIVRAGSVTSSGAITESTSKKVAGSIAASGAIAKSASKPLAGSSTPSGALATLKSFTKQLAGSVAASGTITRAISIVRGGSVSPSGLLQKFASVFRSGSVAPTGALTTSQPSQTLSVSGSVTASGTVTRTIGKQLTSSVALSGAIAKTTAIVKSGVITTAGVLSALGQKLLAVGGAVTAAGTIHKSIVRSVSGSVTPAGVLTRSISKVLVGVITAAGNLLTQMLGAFVAGDARTYMQLSADVTTGIDPGISTELLLSATARTWLQEDPE